MAELSGVFEDKDHAALYARYRPVYPEKVMELISHYMDSNGCSGYERAVDVCCGSGQATMLLSKRFREVYGYDISSEQISQAKRAHGNAKSNVTFAVGDAHHLPIETSSVDLLTVALGWHWLDPDKFYSEAKRVLKPRGCIAVYGYLKLVDNDRVKHLVKAFRDELAKHNCFSKRVDYVSNEYRDVNLPFSNIERLSFDLPQAASMEQIFGFFKSFSSYNAYCKMFPGNKFLETLRDDHCSGVSLSELQHFTYKGFIVLGTNRKK